jgi:hypothetical protein
LQRRECQLDDEVTVLPLTGRAHLKKAVAPYVRRCCGDQALRFHRDVRFWHKADTRLSSDVRFRG